MSGQVKSLNYPTVLLADVIYTLCVRREDGFCGIAWAENISPVDAYYLDASITTSYNGAISTAATPPTDPDIVAYTSATAGDAFITIPGSIVETYGGGTLSEEFDSVADTTAGIIHAYGKPFRLSLNTYGVDNAATLGFDLIFSQLPCGSTAGALA